MPLIYLANKNPSHPLAGAFMIAVMKQDSTNPDHPSSAGNGKRLKSRRRSRLKRTPSRETLGQLAGLGLSRAACIWRAKGPLTDMFVASATSSPEKIRIIRRLGARIYDVFRDDETSVARQKRRRSRRRRAVLAQEGRRRGLFRISAGDLRS